MEELYKEIKSQGSISETSKSVDAISVKVSKLKLIGSVMGVGETIKKTQINAQLKQVNVTSVENMGILSRFASVLALVPASGGVKGNSLVTIRLSTITININFTITTGHTGPTQSIVANTTVVRRYRRYKRLAVPRVTSVTKVLPAHPVTVRMRGTWLTNGLLSWNQFRSTKSHVDLSCM